MYTDGLVEHYDEDLKTGIAHLENVLCGMAAGSSAGL